MTKAVIKDPTVNDAVNVEKVYRSEGGQYIRIADHFIYRNS